VNGIVDESLRALLDVLVAADSGAIKVPVRVWIDTAFNGCLVIPRPQIERLGLKQASTTQAILADGQLVDLETFTCFWIGSAALSNAGRCQRRRVSASRNEVAGGSKAHDRLRSEERRLELVRQ